MILRKILASRWVPLPHSLVVEITSQCNLRCRMCPKTHGAVNTEQNRVMPREVFDRLECLFPLLTAVELSGLWGEAFLHPDLYLGMLARLKAHGINVSTISNGTRLSDELARGLVEAGLDRLVVSMDAARPETYAAIRTPGDMHAVLAGLEALQRWKTALSRTIPKVELAFLGFRSNIEEFPEFVRLAHRLGATKVSLQALGEYEQVRGESVAQHDKETGRRCFEAGKTVGDALGIDVLLFPADQFEPDRAGLNAVSDTARLRKKCPDPWTKPVIATTGDVLPCCSSKRPMGNLLEQPFRAIWYSASYRALRDRIKTGTPPRMCRVCTGRPWVPKSVKNDLVLLAYLCGYTFNRAFGHNAGYRRVKPALKRLRNALVGVPRVED
ncbi:MAG: radical SAM protein [Kiritimatiellae bacterium]|nr:radical SAM protein [Kiritimatiellia bacterium]